jgi:predicted cation transporter
MDQRKTTTTRATKVAVSISAAFILGSVVDTMIEWYDSACPISCRVRNRLYFAETTLQPYEIPLTICYR